ncbi:MAG: hypothetical protein K8F25_05345, partial [Fimbriimonadaceae bacterium]|nr:hypothetical protein [Alphaproteobacteria bacterium]
MPFIQQKTCFFQLIANLLILVGQNFFLIPEFFHYGTILTVDAAAMECVQYIFNIRKRQSG